MLACAACGARGLPADAFSRSQRRRASQGKPSRCKPCLQQHGGSSGGSSGGSIGGAASKAATKHEHSHDGGRSNAANDNAVLSLRQPFASLAVHGVLRVLNLHRWPNGEVVRATAAVAAETPSPVIIMTGKNYNETKKKEKKAEKKPFRLWIHASDQPARDVGRWKATYARAHPDIAAAWPAHFPTNALVGCVAATHVLDGDALAIARPPTMNQEIFASIVVVCAAGAQRLLMPLSLSAPFSPKTCRTWHLPKRVRQSAEQQLAPARRVDGWHADDIHIVSIDANAKDAPAAGGVFPISAEPSSPDLIQTAPPPPQSPQPSERDQPRASRRCEHAFWQIDPLAMTNPLLRSNQPHAPHAPPPPCLPQTYGIIPPPPRTDATAAAAASSKPIVVWFRQDFRVHDNPALHHAAEAARASQSPLICCYIHAPDREEGGDNDGDEKWPLGGAAAVWTHSSLMDLDASLKTRASGAGLTILDARSHATASTKDCLRGFLAAVQAKALYMNRVCEPWKCARDADIIASLTRPRESATSEGGGAAAPAAPAPIITVHTFKSIVLFEPWDARPDTRPECMSLGFGSVGFFRRACAGLEPPGAPLPAPRRLSVLRIPPPLMGATTIAQLGLAAMPRATIRNNAAKAAARNKRAPLSNRHGRPLRCCRYCWILRGVAAAPRRGRRERADALPPRCPHYKSTSGATIRWDVGLRKFWDMTEAGALRALDLFLEEAVRHFDSPQRHRADGKNTAVISPYIRFGQLSPRTVVFRAKEKWGAAVSQTFLRRLVWRDLAYWSLWRFPSLPSKSFRPQYGTQQWCSDVHRLRAWERGMTGYPLVDAAMRQLWAIGWMPNYMRHVVAGFLIEYLNLSWTHGEKWFHDTLVDADVAINSYMWQNGGHSGMDQWNFVMHPVFAAKTCDPEGDYVRRWVPELAGLPKEYVHCPWEAGHGLLAKLGVVLGELPRGSADDDQRLVGCTYPGRVVKDLEHARRVSHAAVMAVRRSKAGRERILEGSGHEWLPLEVAASPPPPQGGRRSALRRSIKAVLITRVDYREGKITTRQTGDEFRDVRKRAPVAGDLFGAAMQIDMKNASI